MSDQNQAIYSSSQKMRTSYVVIDLFKPSAFGLSIYIVIFLLSLFISQPSQYKTAITSFNVNDFQGTFVHKFGSDITKVINSQAVNDIAIYVFWVIVAFIIYVIASRLIKNVSELAEDFSLRQYIWPKNKNKNEPIREFIEKLIFHTFMLIVLIFYLFKATPALFNLWKRYDLTLALNLHSLKVIIVLFIVEILFLHVFVVLVRLFLTRNRIIKI